MTRYHSWSGNRSAFTLVELMMVVLIIAILVSLISAAVAKVMGKIPETQTATEIGQLGTALNAMMADFNLDVPPPSTLVLSETAPLTTASSAFLQKMFGRNLGAGQAFVDWNGDGQPNGPWTLGGEECLVFYLGGINLQGFSYNKMNPTPISGQKMHGPYFNFVTSRLFSMSAAGASGFYVYLDPWETKSGANYATLGGSPYAYFSSQGINNGYLLTTDSYGAAPYFITGSTQCMNPNTYQIISAGKDGYFGTSGWIPAGGATGYGADDQANFSSKVLGAGQQ